MECTLICFGIQIFCGGPCWSGVDRAVKVGGSREKTHRVACRNYFLSYLLFFALELFHLSWSVSTTIPPTPAGLSFYRYLPSMLCFFSSRLTLIPSLLPFLFFSLLPSCLSVVFSFLRWAGTPGRDTLLA